MYPGSKVNWIDRSQVIPRETAVIDNKSLFLTASSVTAVDGTISSSGCSISLVRVPINITLDNVALSEN